VKPIGTDDKPAAKQDSLQQLLAAAYTVQQHNERLHTGEPPENGDSRALKEILEVQEQLRASPLDLRERMALIARRLRHMTQASGSAIGLVNGAQLEYYAATGSAASQAGASLPQESILPYECLRTGQPLECPAAERDSRLNSELCRSLGVKALIAVPIKHEGQIAGVLELHFAEPNTFQEQEVRTCQLFSALVAEAILKPLSQRADVNIHGPTLPTDIPSQSRNPRVNDSESLLAALEKIRPRLEHLALHQAAFNDPRAANEPAHPADGKESISWSASEPAASTSVSASICRVCDQPMGEDEGFCSHCGSPRQTQRVWSSLWELQRKAEESARRTPGSTMPGDAFDEPLDVFPSELEEIVAKFSGEGFEANATESAEVPLPSFAEELNPERALRRDHKSRDDVSLRLDQESAPRERTKFPRPSDDPEERPEQEPDAARLFLPNKSSDYAPAAQDLYPSFSGFASDTNLLSLPADLEPRSSNAQQEMTAPWDEDATEESNPAGESSPWDSATKTKEWLEIQDQRSWLAKQWKQHRANIYLGASALLLLIVLVGWSAPSKPVPDPADTRTPAAGNIRTREAPPRPELSFSEKLLVSLGLAEAPPPEAADQGNPDAKVWIDVHTALYYCPSAELYGKTAGGRTVTQREAQQDQFQPAMRKACE
jgi:GAF domain-containing protein